MYLTEQSKACTERTKECSIYVPQQSQITKQKSTVMMVFHMDVHVCTIYTLLSDLTKYGQ